jgi:hypothetical protein
MIRILVSIFLDKKYGGADRIRTGDLLDAIQALCQLSYNPTVYKQDSTFSKENKPLHERNL